MNKIRKFLSLKRNIKNWIGYVFYKNVSVSKTHIFSTLPNELKINVTYYSYPLFKEIFIDDFYSIEIVLKQITNSPVIIDIGANIGFFTALILSKREDAIIYAYEPFEQNCKLFDRFIQQNPKIAGQVKLFRCAVSDQRNGFITLFTPQKQEQSAIASIYEEFDNRNVTTESVHVTNLGSIICDNNLSKVDILKLDCEGAEYPILFKTSTAELQKIKMILIEVHELDDNERNFQFLESFLQKNGFKTQTNSFNNGCYYTIAINKNIL